jgi:GH15 family glucan-1,4-alpha-glucosidase
MADPRAIAEHGLIGDLRTAALVDTAGRIDWLCLPRFDSPSVFASLLDGERGGHWSLAPTCELAGTHQFYFPDSNVLVTRFLTEDGVVELHDFMPVPDDEDERARCVVRRVQAVRGEMELRMEARPRFDYGREAVAPDGDAHALTFATDAVTLTLRATVPLEATEDGADAVFSVSQGDVATFILHTGDGAAGDPLGADEGRELFDATVGFWRAWLEQSVYGGRWREMVQRSALTLKLLAHRPSGAIVAAPTTSLPEKLGGGRNWDYRFVWPRDAAFSAYALLRLGFKEEARAFVAWLTDRIREAGDGDDGPLAVLYDLDGGSRVPERELDHLAGYRGSRPVRVGNDAASQRQLDIYGEVIDSVYLYDKHGSPISSATWEDLCDIVDWVCEHWDSPDEGIWETRLGRRDHTYSRLMCWVALERMVRMARRRGLPADLVHWTETRDAIYRQIMDRGFNAERGAFVQHYGGDALDAALLLMPMVKFISATDPRFLSTLDRIAEELVSDSLVFRYDVDLSPDGLHGAEGTLSICSFWYVEALTRAGRLEDARLALEKMFTYANHLGLYAEQIGLTGEQLGNFPQAFTHLALISAAINLDRALDAR